MKTTDFFEFFEEKVIVSPRFTSFLILFVSEKHFENTRDSFTFKHLFVDFFIKIMLLVGGESENIFFENVT